MCLKDFFFSRFFLKFRLGYMMNVLRFTSVIVAYSEIIVAVSDIIVTVSDIIVAVSVIISASVNGPLQ